MKKNTLLFLLIFITIYAYSKDKNPQRHPVIFVHGMLGAGDTWTSQCKRFQAKGYQKEYLQVLDWNTLSFGGNAGKQLDSIIDLTLKITKANKVDLVGHSAGGGVCLSYLSKIENAAKVAHYVHIGSSRLSKTPSVPTLNIYSPDDKISGGADVPDAYNLTLKGKDHYEVATCQQTFNALFKFFDAGSGVRLISATPVFYWISGRVLSFGENKPQPNTTIEIYEYDVVNGKRLKEKAEYITTADSAGNWKALAANPYTYYEFVVKPANTNGRTIHYFHEPFTAESKLMYLRTLSSSGMAAMITNNLPSNDSTATLAIFSSNKAVINGRDSLTVNGFNLSAAQFSPAEKTSIAYFVYQQSNKTSTPNPMAKFPFINNIDLKLPVKEKIQIYFNGRNMTLTTLPSSTEGITVAMFD